MTQSVRFEFTSPQFELRSGKVTFTKGGRFESSEPFDAREFHHGGVDGVLVEGPIEFDAMLFDITAANRSDGRLYRPLLLTVTGAISAADLEAGRVIVNLHLPGMLILRVENRAGVPLPGTVVNLAPPSSEATFEGPVDERGELVLFGAAGSWRITAYPNNSETRNFVDAEFDITADDFGERRIVLRM